MKIYYARTAAITEKEVLEKALELLPEKRLEKLGRIKHENGRRECVAAGLLLEYGLRQYGLSGKNVTFHENSDGKPYILEQPDLHYNLSHSGDYVALVMSEKAVGIDVEKLREGQTRLVQRFFAEDETVWLMENWSDGDFTRMWTRKESFLKACGIGMRMPLAGFSVLGQSVVVNEQMPLAMREPDAVYDMASYPIGDKYWLSVCQKDSVCVGSPEEINIRTLL